MEVLTLVSDSWWNIFSLGVTSIDVNNKVKIIVLGNPSVGKTSLISAFLKREKNNPISSVSPQSGSTTDEEIYCSPDGTLEIVDTPGIMALEKYVLSENVPDVIFFVVAASFTQADIDLLQKLYIRVPNAPICVVFNKKDRENERKLKTILKQWSEELAKVGFGKCEVVATKAVGYDVDDDEMDVDILPLHNFLSSHLPYAKQALIDRYLDQRNIQVNSVIRNGLLEIIPFSLLPATSITVTVIQARVLCSLQEIYEPKVKMGNAEIGVALVAAAGLGTGVAKAIDWALKWWLGPVYFTLSTVASTSKTFIHSSILFYTASSVLARGESLNDMFEKINVVSEKK